MQKDHLVGGDGGVQAPELVLSLPPSYFRTLAAPHAASHGVMVDAYSAGQVRQAQREAYDAGFAAKVHAGSLATIEDGPWRSGREFLPFHPSASHINPDYRDGWNQCFVAAQRASVGGWSELTDDDRRQAFESLPDMLDGFLKTWGWLHFAKAIENICREKNDKGGAA